MWIVVLVLLAATSPSMNLYHDGIIDQKWSMTALVALVMLLYVLLSQKKIRLSLNTMAGASAIITLYLCTYTYLSFLLKGSVLMGPFENPNVLALHLCLLLPFLHVRTFKSLLNKVSEKEPQSAPGNGMPFGYAGGLHLGFLLTEILSVLTILLTQCRTAWLCVAFFYVFTHLHGKWKFITLPLLLSLAIGTSLWLKNDSTKGRTFILHNTLELIVEAPLIGHGTDGFRCLYMPKQAEYFKTHQDGEFNMLADDIRHPLNEFLLAGVNHGIVGISLLAVLLVFPLFYAKRLYRQCRPLWFSMSILLVFCLFCYPLLYPMSWLMVAGSWISVFMGRLTMLFHILRTALVAAASFCLLLVLGYTCLLLYWGYASRTSKRGYSADMMEHYERLYPYLRWRGVFLYDYAIESLYADRNEQAYRLAEECRSRCVSYDLALLEGDICRYLRHHTRAQECFDEASLMCPVRFAPLYGKWQVYTELGDTARADSMAEVMRNKDIKVYSEDVKQILEEINNK